METLLKLQALDLRIEACKAREQEIPRQKEKFEIQRKRLAGELAESEQRAKELELEQRECEREIVAKLDEITEREKKLLAVKKNDEYQALIHEMDLIKKNIGIKEERIIAIMVEMDEAKAHLVEDRTRIDGELKQIDAECAKIDAELAEAIKAREALEEQARPLADQAEPALYRKYVRIRKARKTGPAIVPLNDEHCSGCHMRVRPQVVNEIMAGEKTHTCGNCNRMLYYAENFETVRAEIAEQGA